MEDGFLMRDQTTIDCILQSGNLTGAHSEPPSGAMNILSWNCLGVGALPNSSRVGPASTDI